jgi:hypothetical protein
MENFKAIIIMISVAASLIFIGFGIGQIVYKDGNGDKIGETVSIQMHNNTQKRVAYLHYENAVKDQILYDLIVKHRMDSSFVLSVSKHLPPFIMNSKDKRMLPDSLPDKKVLAYQIDNACADWYESIAFMFMDAKHDSAWVLQSESYQRIMETVKPLREKK